jgi:tetratricopeptide (TPR) repeat protein
LQSSQLVTVPHKVASTYHNEETQPSKMLDKYVESGLLPTCEQGHTKMKKTAQAIVGILIYGLLAGLTARGADVHTNPLNGDPLVREAYQRFYILDYDGALQRFKQVQAAHPGDPIAADYVLNATIFRELFRLDLLDTTFYANDGFLSGKHPVPEDPKVRDAIFQLEDKVEAEANARLEKNSKDLDALFARGWGRSLKATYIAMVERSFRAGMHLALQARSDHERVLQADPNYVDAKLVVGVYQYVVGALPFPVKILIGFAGITGSKSKGMDLLHDAANRGVITSVEARTVIALFLRREAKYQEAIGIVRGLKAQYPQDFLFWLEEANLLKDVGDGKDAIAVYRSLLDQSQKNGYFPSTHLDLAWFGLADTLRGQQMYQEAANAYEQAAGAPGAGAELKRRSLVAAGQVYDLMHQREKAEKKYRAAIDSGSDSTQADIARKYLRSPYSGK